jgi:hypothetical protein
MMKNMKVLSASLAAVAVAVVTQAWGQAPADLPAIKTRYQTVQAEVVSVDRGARVVTLGLANGPVSVALGPGVRNFANIHVGDKVVVSYYQGLAVQLGKGDVQATEPAASTFDYRAQSGQPPGAGTGASVTTAVTILAIERDTNTVAFKSPDGSIHLVAVKSPNMVRFLRTLKAGDSVDITYTESLAINVVPAGG